MEEKKPYYKRTWFIILIVLFGLFNLTVIAAAVDEKDINIIIAFCLLYAAVYVIYQGIKHIIKRAKNQFNEIKDLSTIAKNGIKSDILQIKDAFEKQYSNTNKQELIISDDRVMKTPNNSITVINQHKIYDDVFYLLWFSDGKYKNYNPDDDCKNIDIGGIKIRFMVSGDTEPSAMSLSLPIKKPNNELFVEPLGYFPSYQRMKPEQRWIYLNWLANVDNTIDIGYVFTFYYGLERHLFMDRFEEAFEMIIRLRKTHKNNSFLNYSNNALISSLLFHKREDLFRKYLEVIEDMEVSPIYIYVKYMLGIELTPSDIISVANDVGFTNRRYIKSNYDLFKTILTDTINKYNEKERALLSAVDINKCQMKSVYIVANTSISPREINVPFLLSNRTLEKRLFGLLSNTHNNIKLILSEERKKKK